MVGALRGVMTASILNTVVTYEGDLEEGINDYVGGGQEAALGEEMCIRDRHKIVWRFWGWVNL